MASDLMIKKRIQVVKERMVEILRELAYQYERGLIKSPAELQHKVYHTLQAFYDSIGEPTFKQIQAWGPPYSDDHNQMIRQTLDDLYSMYGELTNITSDIRSNYEQVEVERESFTKRILEVEATLNQIESSFSNKSDVMVFREDFKNVERFDKNAVSGTVAHLSTEEGMLTLNRVSGEVFNEYATIRIVKGDGLPGNTHVIRSTGNSLKFDGQENLHINLADILDGNSDTWFEYELFELTQQAIDITGQKDFRFWEPVKWVGKDIKEIRCVFQIELAKPKVMNWISILPYIPSDRGALPAVIEKIVISDEKGTAKSVGFEQAFSTGKSYVFPRQKCQTITVYLRQNTSYPVQVGHYYFMEVNKEEIAVMDEKKQSDGTRIHGTNLPTIESLGVSYDTEKEEILIPTAKYGDTISNEDSKKQNLFTTPETGEMVLAGLEQVPAYRYVIGMRDATIANYRFGNTSQYISTPFVSSVPIQEIQLDAEYEIPEEFEGNDWVQFFISIDNGKKWHPITPKDLQQAGGVTKYLINSKTPKEGRLEEVGYLETLTDVYEVRVKIELARPNEIDEANYYTPILYGYELQAFVREEVA